MEQYVMRYKLHDIDNEQFYMIPKSLFTETKYRSLSNNAKVLYALLKDRMQLSKKNNWADKDTGDIFLLYKQEDLGELMNMSVSSISRTVKELVKFELIEYLFQGLNRPNKIYINKLILTDKISNRENNHSDNVSEALETQGLQICNSGLANMKSRACKYETRTCTDEKPDLQICNSGLANMEGRPCTSAKPTISDTENISKTEKNETERNNTENNDNEKEPVVVIPENTETDIEVDEEIMNMGIGLGVREVLIRQSCMQFEKDYIMEKLEILKSKKRQVKSPSAWLFSALRADYQQDIALKQQAKADCPHCHGSGKIKQRVIDTGEIIFSRCSCVHEKRCYQ